jgi:L-iditol 2-dehydrogenase
LQVAVYHSNSDLRLEERPVPTVGPGELLLRVEASGICGSDLMEWYRVPRAPLVLGHEVAGTVAQAGEGVTSFDAGDRIVTTHHVPCGSCRYCRSDRESVCETLRSTSFDPGGFAEYVRLPAINVRLGTFILPAAISFDEGTFVEPLACVLRAHRIAGVREGDRVAVLGAGVSGILHVQLARALGAGLVAATDVDDQRLAAARRFGVDLALRADEFDVVERLRSEVGGEGFDRVIVCTGALPAFEQALALAAPGGSVVFFAPTEPEERLPVDINDLWRRNVNIFHSYAGPPAEMRRAIELIREGAIDVAGMITDRLPLGGIQDGFHRMQAGADSLKVVIRPHD